jgi:hypothetical protein
MQEYFRWKQLTNDLAQLKLSDWNGGLLSFARNFPLDKRYIRAYLRIVEQQTLEFLSTRIPTKLMEQLERLAEEERRSLSQMAYILLEEAIQKRNGGKKK